ncbi:MAG TPA: FAD:protein FMN transferase [Pseudothermotoga sp.]|nr:FAD:protein FMN transferase [Pseudothermotoga sp.]
MRKKDRESFLRTNRLLFILLFVGLAIIFSLTAAVFVRSQHNYYEYDGFTLGTYCRIVVSSKKGSKSLAEIMFDEMDRIYKKYNLNDENSFLSKINASKDWVDLDEETFVLLDAAVKFSEITSGAFDPALGNLIELWGFNKIAEHSPETVPSKFDIAETLKKSGVRNVELDRNTRRIRLLNGVKLDLGGIAKGYALDRAYQIAKEIDPECTGFVEAGGDIRILGPKFGSRPWVVGVKDPRKADSVVTYLYLTEGAVATSGDYERYFILDNVRYHHILSPETGYPAQGAQSATVVAKDAVTADALSTAAFVMAKDWEYVVLEYPKFGGSVLIITEDGSVCRSPSMRVYEQAK